MPSNFITFIIFGILALGVSYFLFRNLPRLIDYLFDRLPGFKKMDKTLAYFLSDSFGIALVIMATIYFITMLPENATFIAVLLTIGSGAFIFISEGWFGDALAGVSLQLFPQYKVGDWVTLAGNKRGQVKRLGLFRTELVSIDLDVVSIKNSTTLSEDIINHSGIPLRRLDIIAHTASYGDFGEDIRDYKAVVLEIAERVQDEICPDARKMDRHPQVLFMEFGPSSDHIHVIFYTYDRDEMYGGAIDAIHTALAAELRPRGVVLAQVNANTLGNVISLQHVNEKK